MQFEMMSRDIPDDSLSAPMSFFTSTDTGTTTNRFSQDLELVDMELPTALIRTCLSMPEFN